MISRFRALPAGMRTYTLIWSGQLVSIVGSAMTDFAVAVWVLRETGSAAAFGVVLMMGILPGILVSLVSGVLVDRWDRRRTLMVSDSASAAATLALAFLYLSGGLALWHVCAAVAVGSVARGFQMPAWAATTPLLVPAEQLGRASGMMNFARSAGQILGPLLGGTLVVVAGLGAVLLVDVVTFCVAMATLAAARFPAVPRSEGAQAVRGSVLREAAFGWRYIWERPSLRSHLFFFALINLGVSYVAVLFPPMVLGFADAAVLGRVAASVGFGMLLGSVLMTATGGPPRQVPAMLAVGAAVGLCMVTMGLRPSALLVGGSLFVLCLGVPLLNGAFMRLWQPRIAADVQGRTFAAMQVMAWSSQPIAFLSGGVLADRVFVPLLLPGGPLADSLGTVIGVGPGRGIGLLLGLAGAAVLAGTAVAALRPHFRRAESLVPVAVVPVAAPAEPEPAGVPEPGSPVPA